MPRSAADSDAPGDVRRAFSSEPIRESRLTADIPLQRVNFSGSGENTRDTRERALDVKRRDIN